MFVFNKYLEEECRKAAEYWNEQIKRISEEGTVEELAKTLVQKELALLNFTRSPEMSDWSKEKYRELRDLLSERFRKELFDDTSNG